MERSKLTATHLRFSASRTNSDGSELPPRAREERSGARPVLLVQVLVQLARMDTSLDLVLLRVNRVLLLNRLEILNLGFSQT